MARRILIIGGGPGGYTAAFEAARRGAEVILAERERLGGTCLARGCIPTKTLRASADALCQARRLGEYGFSGAVLPGVDMKAVMARKNKVVGLLQQGLDKSAKSLGVRVVQGTARLESAREAVIVTSDGEERVSAEAVIIATGSKSAELPGLAFDGEYVLGSDMALDLDHIPERLCVLGGGVIGCELASVFRAFGSDVTIVEAQDRLLPVPGADRDLSALLAREFRKQKIRVLTGKTLGVVISDGAVRAMAVPSPFAGERGGQNGSHG